MTVILLIPFVSFKRIKSVKLAPTEWLLLGLTGAFLGLHFLFWMESLTYTSVASSMVILTLQPFFAMLGCYFLFKERLNLHAGICMFIASLGSLIIAWGDIGISKGALFGDLLSLIGTIMAAIYMLSGQKLSHKLPVNLYNIVVFSVGGFVLFVYNILQGKEMIHYAAEDWLYFVILAVIPTVFGQSIFNLLLPYLGATTVSVGIIGEPILAIIMAYLLLGEIAEVNFLVVCSL
jgi:drug/metabolite transporter (DMT)-like permease